MNLSRWIGFTEEVEPTPEEEEWWAQVEPTFRRRLLIRAGARALLVIASIAVVRWLSGSDQLPPLAYLASFATIYALFGLNVIKGELVTKRHQVIEARRVEQAVLAESDEPPVALPPSPAPARRFK